MADITDDVVRLGETIGSSSTDANIETTEVILENASPERRDIWPDTPSTTDSPVSTPTFVKHHRPTSCQQRFKLINEGDIQVCRLNHTRTIVSKIMNSKYLRRWESHHIILGGNDMKSSMVSNWSLSSLRNIYFPYNFRMPFINYPTSGPRDVILYNLAQSYLCEGHSDKILDKFDIGIIMVRVKNYLKQNFCHERLTKNRLPIHNMHVSITILQAIFVQDLLTSGSMIFPCC